MGSGRSPMYTRQQLDAGTCSHADGKPAATPAATRWSRSVVLVVQTTCSRRLLVATATDVLQVTVTCSLASPETRYAFVPFSRTSYATVAPILTDVAAGTMPMRMLPAYGSSTLRAAPRGGAAAGWWGLVRAGGERRGQREQREAGTTWLHVHHLRWGETWGLGGALAGSEEYPTVYAFRGPGARHGSTAGTAGTTTGTAGSGVPPAAPGSGFGSVAHETTVCNGVEPRQTAAGSRPFGPKSLTRRQDPHPARLRLATLPRAGGGLPVLGFVVLPLSPCGRGGRG